jgi:hypothetical protein
MHTAGPSSRNVAASLQVGQAPLAATEKVLTERKACGLRRPRPGAGLGLSSIVIAKWRCWR